MFTDATVNGFFGGCTKRTNDQQGVTFLVAVDPDRLA
jgi:hypothetical protein